MDNVKICVSASLGVLRAFVITLIVILIFAFISTKIHFSDGITNMVIMVSTLISIMYGAIYASKKSGEKGWLNGLLVGILYIVIFYIVSIICGSSSKLEVRDFIRVVLAVLVGTLSGMLGINI
ncbi:TIGR04086 family membrane protein [Clostridium guangxiense]|uniref:TIGR04086 family membrane protein n=1 Tax=Clostridium guangxiense TaxID=1662055 RepID=UPI001E4F2CB6|nr:TIGR04086 family membrane protein [Clostridium guangxiense]